MYNIKRPRDLVAWGVHIDKPLGCSRDWKKYCGDTNSSLYFAEKDTV